MAGVFGLSKPLWEFVIRATMTYFAVVFLVPVIPKRNAGHISPNDMLTRTSSLAWEPTPSWAVRVL
jgi:hypothetical protein